MKLKRLKIERCFVRKHGETEGRFADRDEIDSMGELEGELLDGGDRWGANYGVHRDYATIVAWIDQSALEPGFSSRGTPLDSEGNEIEAGREYLVRRGGHVRTAVVFEGETGDLLCRFAGHDRPQRLDEIADSCSWEPAARVGDNQGANGVSRGAGALE